MEIPIAQRNGRVSAAFLRLVIVLIGIAALGLLLWEPHLKGRDARATILELHFTDPFLAYAYLASIPFFVALYQGFRFLGYADRSRALPAAVVEALRTTRSCAIAVIGCLAISLLLLIVLPGDVIGADRAGKILYAASDDRPAGVYLRLLIAFPTLVVAAAAATFEQILQNAQDTQAANDAAA